MNDPELRVVYGDPTEEEICALVCALRLISAREAEPPSRPGARALHRVPQTYRSPRSWSTPSTLRRP
ncbi:acyl-CoA carboxylase subunit epsilon [Streptosporangium sp. NPDC051022]|uniref:acyl-CoA carboxylase subunit epsilon n=1 Tax=Streptosporangium sp. NPDC051022 TaxID=3155752 RepID=UPI0034384659